MATTSDPSTHADSPTDSPTTFIPDLIIDLTATSEPPSGHRLTELVQALTGCSVERAEFAVSDPTPEGPTSSEDALRKMAQALVRLKTHQPA